MAAVHLSKGPFANEGERRVVAKLVEALPPGARVISNLYLPNRGDTLEIDAVVLMPYGVVVVETKDWKGRLVFNAGGCRRDDDRIDDPRPLTSFKAKVLHSRLRRWDAPTAPLVVLAREPDGLRVEDDDSVPVKVLEAAVAAVRTGQVLGKRARSTLAESDLREITQALVGEHDAHHARSVGSYLLGESTGTEDGDEFWATEGGSSGLKVRLKRYTIDELAPFKEREEQLQAARRAFEVLRHLQSKRMRSLPIVYTFQRDPEDDSTLWMAYEGVEGDTLLDAPLAAKDKVNALASVADALARCHAAGVVHRSLSPDRLIVPKGEKVPVILHFDLAHLADAATIGKGAAGRRIRNLTRTPPEVRDAVSRASASTDVYALGITGIEVLTGATVSTHEEARQAAKKLRPRELAPVLLQAIEQDAKRRTRDMQTLADALRKVIRA